MFKTDEKKYLRTICNVRDHVHESEQKWMSGVLIIISNKVAHTIFVCQFVPALLFLNIPRCTAIKGTNSIIILS